MDARHLASWTGGPPDLVVAPPPEGARESRTSSKGPREVSSAGRDTIEVPAWEVGLGQSKSIHSLYLLLFFSARYFRSLLNSIRTLVDHLESEFSKGWSSSKRIK